MKIPGRGYEVLSVPRDSFELCSASQGGTVVNCHGSGLSWSGAGFLPPSPHPTPIPAVLSCEKGVEILAYLEGLEGLNEIQYRAP